MYAKIFQKLLQNFFLTRGRAPITPNEWSKLRKQAMELARKEGGEPITGRPFPGWKPRVIQGGKGLESLIKKGDVTVGTAPKTKKSTLDAKKDVLEGQINKEKWIARKKQENKDAIRRFKEKNPRTVEDFRDKGDWDPGGMAEGGIAPLVGEPSYAADFYDDRTPMKKGNRALTNVQNEFLKMQLANNPEYIAKYFPNVVTQGPSGPLYDVNYDHDKPGNVFYEDGAEFRDVNVPYDTKGSRLNIRATPEQEYRGGMPIRGMKQPGKGIPSIRRFPRRDPDYTEYAYMKPDEQFYQGKEITGGQTQAINMAPWILESYGTKASSPRNEMVNSPEWWTKAGEHFNFETGPTVDQATLNDFIESVLAHETAHGVADKSLYKSDTKEATTLDFKKFLTPNQKQGHRYKNFKVREYDQEEMFTRMKDIERLKKMYPDSYEKHPLWKLYQNRAEMQFKRITGQEEQDKVVKKGFNDYKKKIKPMVDEYFEKIEMKGRGIADINIEKEEIGMPEHLTREEPFEREYGSPFAQGGRIGLAGGGGIIKLLKKFLKKKPKKDVIKPFEFPDAGIGSDFQKKLLDDMLKSKSRLKDFDPKGKPHAEGGRIGLAGGGALFKFIEKLFIKASNDIRLGRGKWKGLDRKQIAVQHDNLTKKLTEWEKTGNTEGLEVYFDVNPHEAFAAAEKKAARKAKDLELLRNYQEETGLKTSYGSKDSIPGDEGIMDAVRKGNAQRAEKEALQAKYPGISDDLLEKILVDDNPQRKADVIGTIDDYMKLREVGKSEAEAYDIITQSFSKNPTKHAEGGRIGFNPGGPVDHDALVQMYIAEGLSYEEAVQAAQSAANLPWDTLKKAEGGRIGYAGGGQAGLPAVTLGLPHGSAMQQPQMPVGPQPAGIPGGTIVAQNQMQQNPWMGSQMQQGIGGMPQRGQPRPGGMPRPMAAEGGRIGFGLGGINKGRRAFMKWLAGILGTGVAAGTGLLKLGKAAKIAPKVTETIVQSNASGMPAWFPSLVKKVLKEGKDETATLGTIERQTVHTAKTPEGTPIQVTRDLTTDDILVDIGEQTKHGWGAGRHGQPVRLELKKGEWIEPSTEGGGYMTKGGENVYPGMSKGAQETAETSGKGIKTKDEFSVQEAEFTGGHPENVKFEETVEFQYGDHGSDFSEIERFAIGKNKDKKIIGKQAARDDWAEGRAMEQAEDVDDYASGGLARMLGE